MTGISHFSGVVLPYDVAAVRNVSFLPGVAIATGDNKRRYCRRSIHDKNITRDHMLHTEASCISNEDVLEKCS